MVLRSVILCKSLQHLNENATVGIVLAHESIGD